MSDGPIRTILVINPSAGKGRAGSELVRLRHFLATSGHDVEVFLTQAEGEAATIVAGLELGAGSVVIAGGGDGTVHEVGRALMDREDREIILGVLPLGSGNDYAALLGMPEDPVDAMRALLAGTDERWDVGSLGPHVFFNTVGFGLSASVSYQSRFTGPLRGLPRYGLAVVKALWRHRPVVVGVDGLQASGVQHITLMEVGIGTRCGGGFHLTPQADPADGLLDVCLVKAMPRGQMPLLLPKGLSGKHLGHPSVRYEQVANFRLKLDTDQMVHVDGEIRVLPKGEHSVKVLPRAILVRIAAPAGAPA